MEWNLICDDKWKASFIQLAFQGGTLLGSLAFGAASDRFGRRKPFLVACVGQLLFGVLGTYMASYGWFTLFRFIVGLTVGGTMVIGFVIIMEFVGPEYRELLACLYQVPFSLGCMLSPLIAYFFRDFRDFHLALSIPSAVLAIYFYSLPETPRWLIAKNMPEKAITILTHVAKITHKPLKPLQPLLDSRPILTPRWLIAVKRTEEAIGVLERVAKINNRPTENIRADIEAYQASLEKHQLKKGNILDLFRTPNLRKNIIAMAFNWLTCSYCFYGVSQYVGQLSGNAFINVACSASVTLFGTFLSIPLMKFIGRKSIVIIFHLVCTVCLLVLAVIPEGVGSVICASIGVVASFIVFVVVYLYCTELFPTVVRNAALGFSSMAARIGSMIAPFVIETRAKALWMPPVAFAVLPLIAAFITILLPETKGCELTTTLEEGEAFGKKTKSLSK